MVSDVLSRAEYDASLDGYSGEGAEDLDEDTYWIPIGFTDADENGEDEIMDGYIKDKKKKKHKGPEKKEYKFDDSGLPYDVRQIRKKVKQ